MKVLLNGLIDYAGLFPPAQLSMADAVAEFARQRRSPHAFALARFICPLTRIDEWTAAAANHLATEKPPADQPAPDAWGLSVLLDGPLDAALAAIERFNDHHALGAQHKHAHSAVIDTIEIKVQTPEIIDKAINLLPEDLFPFFEVPPDADFRGFAAALAGTGFGAKLRTGGVVPQAIPTCERVADFLITFGQADVPIKCTAGLHHPIRGEYALTYAPDSPRGVMHGFLNVFLAAAMVRAGRTDRVKLIALLSETTPQAFNLGPSSAAWRDLRIDLDQLAEAREEFAICFGSCSFREPIAELTALGQL